MPKPAAKSIPAPARASTGVRAQPRFPVWLLAGLLALVTFAVYWPAMSHDFVNYDDSEQVYDHPVIKEGLTVKGIVWVLTHSDDGHWIPLNKISHMLDCQIYGLKPGGHHLTNVLLHAATVVGLFLVLRRMTSVTWPSAFVAAVFSIHPLRVESVAWVAERKDVLSGFFFMLALWAYVRYVQRKVTMAQPSIVSEMSDGHRPLRSVDYWLALVFFGCGLLSKAMVVTLPLVLLLLDYWPLNRLGRVVPAMDGKKRLSVFLRLILEKIWFLGPVIVAGAGLLLSRNKNNVVVVDALWAGQGIVVPHVDLSTMGRTGQALMAPLVYLKQMFFPAGLAVYTPPVEIARWEMLSAAMVLLAITVGVFALRRQRLYLLVGWLWYLVILGPVLLMIQNGSEIRCDRYTYLPQIGVYLLFTWAACEMTRRRRHHGLMLSVMGSAIIVTCMALTRQQLGYWQDGETLFRHALEVTDNNYYARFNLGIALHQKGQFGEAVVQYQESIRLKPDYADAHNNFGNALNKIGQSDDAISQYEEAIRLKSDYAEAHNNLGAAIYAKGQTDEAIRQYREAIRLQPDFAEARFNLGSVLFSKGQTDEAISQFREAIALQPDDAEAHYNLGTILFSKGQTGEAINQFREAIRLKSDYAEAYNNLGIALLRKGQTDEAIKQFQEVIGLKPDHVGAYNNLGTAYAGKGEIDKAIIQFREAVRLNPDDVRSRENLARALGKKIPPASP